jgi:hypothetical protein
MGFQSSIYLRVGVGAESTGVLGCERGKALSFLAAARRYRAGNSRSSANNPAVRPHIHDALGKPSRSSSVTCTVNSTAHEEFMPLGCTTTALGKTATFTILPR